MEFFDVIAFDKDKDYKTKAYNFTSLNLRFDDNPALEEYLSKNGIMFEEKSMNVYSGTIDTF